VISGVASTSTLSLPTERMHDATPLPSLRKLTTALARGDDTAWLEFHRVFGPRLFRQLLAATRGDHDLASEALQQTYLRVARHARACDEEPVFLAWLRTVARSALNDCIRRRRSFWAMLQRRHADPSQQADATPDDDRLFVALDHALAALDVHDRSLLEAKYFAGANVRSLATRLTISEKAVESRLTRARAALRCGLLAALSHHE